MLPIRLGTVNAQGKQELFVFALTREGRVETTNYRTVELPSGMELPAFIKKQSEFGDFYRDMFRNQVNKEQVTGNRQNFQGRYVIRHPFTGPASCEAGRVYFNDSLPKRQTKVAENLARLTARPIVDIRHKMNLTDSGSGDDNRTDDNEYWWESLWH